MRYQFIQNHQEEFNLALMFRMLEVSSSGFYDWQGRPKSPRNDADQELLKAIKEIQ